MESIALTVCNYAKALIKEYKYFCDYVLSMARAHEDNDEFNNILLRLNNTRKYYSDLLARRVGSAADEPVSERQPETAS